MTKRVLVIDDEESIRKSFTLALEDTPYQIDTVDSGEKGIEKKKKNDYNLIFLDLKMPGIDGVQTLREIRKMDQDTPIYIVTAFYEEFFKPLKIARAEEISFELLKKPVSAQEIVMVVESILENPSLY